MKFYLDKDDDLLTEEQFKKRFFTKKIIFNMLLDGYFHNEFIKNTQRHKIKLFDKKINEDLNQIYEESKIGNKMKYGEIQIIGCGLTLEQMTRAKLVVTGRIDNICLRRREKG